MTESATDNKSPMQTLFKCGKTLFNGGPRSPSGPPCGCPSLPPYCGNNFVFDIKLNTKLYCDNSTLSSFNAGEEQIALSPTLHSCFSDYKQKPTKNIYFTLEQDLIHSV